LKKETREEEEEKKTRRIHNSRLILKKPCFWFDGKI